MCCNLTKTLFMEDMSIVSCGGGKERDMVMWSSTTIEGDVAHYLVVGDRKMQFSGIWMRRLCQKVPIVGVYGAFRSAISSAPLSGHWKFKILGPGDQYSGVWYHTFRLWRPQIRGFASYIWAPKPEFLGVTV